jgi:hypothetical protein
MKVEHDGESGGWRVVGEAEERERLAEYLAALERYLNGFDALFARARDRDEFQFIVAMLGVFSLQDAGWVPYETTEVAIRAATALHNEAGDEVVARHLKLWIFGHIVEASAPYDLLGNLIRIANGERAQRTCFPPEKGRSVSPGTKIDTLASWALADGRADVGELLRAIWDRQLRNAIFHADYALHGAEVRLPGIGETRTADEVELITANASAYHDAVVRLRRSYLRSYTEPTLISAASFSNDPKEQAVVIVRAGEGAIGLKDALTPAEIAAGRITFRIAKLYPDERELLDADPTLARLPARTAEGEHADESVA